VEKKNIFDKFHPQTIKIINAKEKKDLYCSIAVDCRNIYLYYIHNFTRQNVKYIKEKLQIKDILISLNN